jgi:hypothetical protein
MRLIVRIKVDEVRFGARYVQLNMQICQKKLLDLITT